MTEQTQANQSGNDLDDLRQVKHEERGEQAMKTDKQKAEARRRLGQVMLFLAELARRRRARLNQ